MTNQYVTGSMIKALREKKKMTQAQLAEKLNVTDKAISKWETGRGLPDIALLEGLASALGLSVIELLSGENVINTNRASNMLRSQFYVCPVCGNVIQSTGQTLVSCCGITLPLLEAEPSEAEPAHKIKIQPVEDEYYVTLDHPMTKDHYISFIAAISDSAVQLVKLYPEGSAQARFKINGVRKIFAYCNRHGLFEEKVCRNK